MHVGQPEVASVKVIGWLRMIKSELVQDHGLEIVDVDSSFDDVEAEIVG